MLCPNCNSDDIWIGYKLDFIKVCFCPKCNYEGVIKEKLNKERHYKLIGELFNGDVK